MSQDATNVAKQAKKPKPKQSSNNVVEQQIDASIYSGGSVYKTSASGRMTGERQFWERSTYLNKRDLNRIHSRKIFSAGDKYAH